MDKRRKQIKEIRIKEEGVILFTNEIPPGDFVSSGQNFTRFMVGKVSIGIILIVVRFVKIQSAFSPFSFVRMR